MSENYKISDDFVEPDSSEGHKSSDKTIRIANYNCGIPVSDTSRRYNFGMPFIPASVNMPTVKDKNNGYDCIINKTQVQKQVQKPEIDTIKYKFHSKIPLIGWFIDLFRDKNYTESEEAFNDRIKTNNLKPRLTRNIYKGDRIHDSVGNIVEQGTLVQTDEYYMSDEDYEKYTQYQKDYDTYLEQTKLSQDKQKEASCYLNYNTKKDKILDLRLRLTNILNSHRVVVRQTIYKNIIDINNLLFINKPIYYK